MANLFEKSKQKRWYSFTSLFFLNNICLQGLKKILKSSTYEEYIEQFWMSSDRADVIVPASLMCSALLKFSRAKTIAFPIVGLRVGLLSEIV